MNNIDRIKSFNANDYVSERSSGYSGYRHINTGEWITVDMFQKRVDLVRELEEKLEFLDRFRSKYLPFGKYPDYILLEFINTHFKKQVEQICP